MNKYSHGYKHYMPFASGTFSPKEYSFKVTYTKEILVDGKSYNQEFTDEIAVQRPFIRDFNQCEHEFEWVDGDCVCVRCAIINDELEFREPDGDTFIRHMPTKREIKENYFVKWVNAYNGVDCNNSPIYLGNNRLQDIDIERDWDWKRVWSELRVENASDVLTSIPHFKGKCIDLDSIPFYNIWYHMFYRSNRVNAINPSYILRQILLAFDLWGLAKWVPCKLSFSTCRTLNKSWNSIFPMAQVVYTKKGFFDNCMSSCYDSDLNHWENDICIRQVYLKFPFLYTNSMLSPGALIASELERRTPLEKFVFVISNLSTGQIVPSEIMSTFTVEDDQFIQRLSVWLIKEIETVERVTGESVSKVKRS